MRNYGVLKRGLWFLWMVCVAVASHPDHGLAAENWNPAVNMGPVINSPATEKAPEISPDGLTLYFSHNSPLGDINIFYSQWDGSAWGPPIDMGGVVNSSPQNDWGPTLAGDGNTMYFASNRPGGYGGYDIYRTRRVGGVWQPPQNVGPTINSNVGELGQDTNPEETVLWFVRGWPEPRPTNEDIFYSVKVNGQWTTPVQWELNTPYLEDNPDISPDGNKLYFTAIYDTIYGGGYGSFDIWLSERIGGVWQTPVNLGPAINTVYHDANPSISNDGQTLFFTRGDAPGGYGGFDLYWATWAAPSPGDLNCDAVVNTLDIEPFVLALLDPAGYATAYPNCQIALADISGDGMVNGLDIEQFVLLLTGR